MRFSSRYLIALLFLLLRYAYGQELVPGNNSRLNGKPYHRIIQHADGSTLVFGSFDHINGEYIGRLAKLDNSGKMVTGFHHVYTNNTIYHARVQNDGKILIAGRFTTINGNATKNLVRLNADGSIDPSFTSAVDGVSKFELQHDGRIVALVSNEFVRLNTDGNLDGGFSMQNYVYQYTEFAIAPDDHIYFVATSTVHKLKPDGADDASFHVGTGVNSSDISALTIQHDGKILIGGGFTKYNGVAANGVVRLNADGQVDPGFSLGTGTNGHVFSILKRQNGNLVIGGQFTQYDNQPANLVELRADGALHKIVAVVYSNWITSIIETPGQEITFAGEFSRVNNMSRFCTARFNSDYTLNDSFVPAISYTNSNGRVLGIRKSSAVITGGYADDWSGIYNDQRLIRKPIVQYNALGGYDYSFSAKGITNDTPYVFDALLVQDDDKVLLSGNLREYDNPKLIRLNADGSLDNSFAIGKGPEIPTPFGDGSRILRLKQKGDALYVAGNMVSFNGVTTHGIASLNLDGSIRKAYPLLPSNISVVDLEFQSDGKMIAIGYIPPAGSSSKKIIRINTDGSIDNTFAELNIGGSLNSIQIDSHDRIYLGGDFRTINGGFFNNIARLLPDGNVDPAFSVGTGFDSSVRSLILLPDGRLAAGGYFSQYKGVSANGFVILGTTGSNVTTSSLKFGLNSNVVTMQHSAGALFLAGRLVKEDNTNVDGHVKIALSPLTLPDAVPANLKVSLQTAGTFKLQWEDQSTNELAFILERATGSSSQFTVIDTVNSNVTFVTDHEIQGKQEYFYRVKSVNDAGSSAYSNVASLLWIPAPAGNITLSVTPLTERKIQLTWPGTVTDHLGFIIQRSRESNGNYIALDTVATDIHTFTDMVAEEGTYFYQVAAYNEGGELYSNKISTVISGLENEATSTSVYPVPARDFIFAATSRESANGTWWMVSTTGERVPLRRETHSDGVVSIDVQSFAPGIYILQYSDGKTTWQKKIMKQ